MEYLTPGILWITFIFTGLLGLSRSFITEKDKNSFEGLMLCPVNWNVIYLGKIFSNLILMFIVEAVTIITFSIFFNFDFIDKIPLLVSIIILGTLGFVIVGALLSAISMNIRNREVLLPVLLLPILIPIIITAVAATGKILVGGTSIDILDNLKILGAYNIIFFITGLFTFEYIIQE